MTSSVNTLRDRSQRRWTPTLRYPRSVAWTIAATLTASLPGCVTDPLGDTEAALALEDIVAGYGGSRLKSQTPKPERHTLQYAVDGRVYLGDLYRSSHRVDAGLVLVPGVVPRGKDDRRLVALAQTLARLRFAVLVPELHGLRKYQARAHHVREVADAFRYLSSLPDLLPDRGIGLAGFSYGAATVLLAALKQDIRPQVRFIVALGGYYDLDSLVTYFTTGYYRGVGDAQWRRGYPHPYIEWVFTVSNAELLARPRDRSALRAYAAEVADGSTDEEPALTAHLAPDAEALYALLSNHDPNRVPTLIGRLSRPIRTELEAVNPAGHDLSRLQAQVILIHGRDDTMIPYTESVALAQALPPGQVQLFIIDGIAHVDIRPQRQDIRQLLAAMEALLTQRGKVRERVLH